MRLIYTKPKLKNLDQGSRIAFVRQFRQMTQDELSDELGLTGESKRRSMTKYEKGGRHPKDNRVIQIANILKISKNCIKNYCFENKTDIIFLLMWFEELIPNYEIDITNIPMVDDKDMLFYKNCISKINDMKRKKSKFEISYNEYMEWKLTYNFEDESNIYE